MPAITLGLAEVEERLRALRRRMNTFAVLQAVCVGLTTLVLVSTALIVLGLSGSVAFFHIAAWAGALVSVGTLGACAAFVGRRWLDINATAHLADRRGQLTDRLATLVDVRARPRTSRLAPVLVAQVLALGGKWQPQRIAPRRIPRSAFALIAALLALASSPLIAPAPSVQSASAKGSVEAGVPLKASQAGAGRSNTESREGMGASSLSVNPLGGEESAQWDAGAPADQPAERPPPDGLVAPLPDQLRRAILSAFHREASDAPQRAAARTDGGAADEHENRARREQREAKPGSAGGQNERAQQRAETGEKTPSGERQPGQQLAQQGPGTSDPNRIGPAPAAGAGTSPSGLMGTTGDGTRADPHAPKSFKLTIASSLHGAQQTGALQRQPLTRPALAGNSRDPGSEQLALSERQLSDDALRKTAIPPEYEDLVRRVFSARGEP